MSIILKLFVLFLSLPAVCFSATAASADQAVGRHDLTIHFIDVGHGDATFVNCPNGNLILVDAGSSSGFPGGKLRYYLLKQGKMAGKALEALIITQPDRNNYNLISRALDKVPVKRIYLAGKEDDYNDLKFSSWLKGIDQSRRIFLDSDYFNAENAPNPEIACGEANIHILAAAAASDDSARNSLSIVLMIRYGDFAVILPGDAPTATADDILGRYAKEWLEADVLKIGNRGNLATSPSEQWLKTIKPKVAIVSAGAKNRDGLPRKEMLERLEPYTLNNQAAHKMESARWDSAKNEYLWHSSQQYSEAIYATATNGTVVVKSDGSDFETFFAEQK